MLIGLCSEEGGQSEEVEGIFKKVGMLKEVRQLSFPNQILYILTSMY